MCLSSRLPRVRQLASGPALHVHVAPRVCACVWSCPRVACAARCISCGSLLPSASSDSLSLALGCNFGCILRQVCAVSAASASRQNGFPGEAVSDPVGPLGDQIHLGSLTHRVGQRSGFDVHGRHSHCRRYTFGGFLVRRTRIWRLAWRSFPTRAHIFVARARAALLQPLPIAPRHLRPLSPSGLMS